MILNLGCGGNPRLHNRLLGSNIINYDLNPKASWLDIRGDAHCLPFDSDTFRHTLAFHVIEHCNNPLLVSQELRRVTHGKVVFKVPNAVHYNFMSEDIGHIYSWNSSTLRNFLERIFPKVDIKPSWVLRAKDYPRKISSLLLVLANKKQTELTAICEKK